ncbi:unnamed protein product [Schistosoma margrebowiei]|uniref:DUF6451 domain-containing protein n=1 Tax=Schistosoma margrebowiei TaxID=48269 RepID=A0A3P8EMG4_9TREM|nr:unnamed protein product [Schistosoma margrebowiei]
MDDLDFADDLVLLSQTQQQMQEKTVSSVAVSVAVTCTNPFTIDGEDLEDVKPFTYSGSIIDEHGGSDADMKARISKARAAYLQLKNIWKSKQLSTNTKIRIFNTNVKTLLLYGAETWRTTKAIIQKIQQQRTVGENKPDPRGGRNQEEALKVDRTHIEDSTELRHKTSPHMESSRPKEKRRIEEHITPRNGNRHEKDEQELDGIRKEGPGQSGLENAGRQPMLHWD